MIRKSSPAESPGAHLITCADQILCDAKKAQRIPKKPRLADPVNYFASICSMHIKKLIIASVFSLFVSSLSGQETEIYVSDAGNFRDPPWQILKFDENGDNPQVFINEHLAWPQDIVFLDDSNTVLISNLNSGRITRYNATTGAYIDDFASVSGEPTRMKIGKDGLLYVLQWSGNGKVLRYRLNGTYMGEFTNAGVSQSIGLDWDSDGNLYVASFDGTLVRKFDTNGKDQGVFIDSDLVGPTNITFDQNGDLLVSDYTGLRVKRFDSSGNYLGVFIGGVSQVEGIDVFEDGNILLGIGGNASVRMYDSEGKFVEEFVGRRAGNLITPNAIVIRNDNTGSTFDINAGLNDAWFSSSTSGQGFLISVFPNRQEVFAAWFTYDTERPSEDVTALLGEPGHRWLTAQGPYDGDTANLTIYVTEGGVFDAVQPAPSTDPAGDGTMTIQFADCTQGLVSYEITSLGISGEIPIERITPDNIALCEALANP